MKLMHLSDLHLGKRVNEFSMIEDQKYILSQIISLLDREGADGVILAGDIYDKPIPSVEAVQLFDSFLTRLAKRKLPVFVISGNHDSVERVSFGAQLMEREGIYISQVYDGKVQNIVLTDQYGEVCIYLLPFLKPASVRHVFEEAEISTYQDALKKAIGEIEIDKSRRNVVVAHQFVTGASRCESEEILVGGLDQVDASLFDSFDYAALGHLHSPQRVGRETVRYCGTLLKYSFSEAEQEKSVTIAELKEKGNIEIRTIPLKPLRDMRKIRGTYLQVTEKSFYEGINTEDYLQITLTDEEDIPDGMQKLRIIYPNLMRLEYDNQRTRENRSVEAAEAVEQKSEAELFEEFFELQNNRPMSEQQQIFVKRLIQKLQEKGFDK
ncbi:MAG: exonuclease SbcCD subunit D [Marvinbryantia sp.]|uniref:exonuclease SbcCD subunit D n=1 Tax=Marvinbryantia sp. TaxID=2496532 RepID=UPI002670ABC1|nr:exonuclease SbcCD subunit D [uncultured Marvinbryantia sp.]